jgi:steroid delta-isomerase-like uncharacterized protein
MQVALAHPAGRKWPVLPTGSTSFRASRSIMDQEHVIRRFVAGPINNGRFEELEELFEPDARFYSVFRDEPFLGPQGVKQFFTAIRIGWPDVEVTIDDFLTAGDRAAARVTTRGTNSGPIRDFPPSGKRAEFGEMFFFRFENGRIAEFWQQQNVLSTLRQMGRAPTEAEMKRLQTILPVLKAVGKVVDFFGRLRPRPADAA